MDVHKAVAAEWQRRHRAGPRAGGVAVEQAAVHDVIVPPPSRRRRELCHPAAPPSPCSRCFNADGEGVSVI